MSQDVAYPHLLSPLRIGATEVRNRIMQTAHAKMYSQNGHDTQRDAAPQGSTTRRITLKNQIDTTTTILPGMTNPTWRRRVHMGLRKLWLGKHPKASSEARPCVNRLAGS